MTSPASTGTGGGMSLYADLLDSNSNNPSSDAQRRKQTTVHPALQFQARRQQLASQRPKAKTAKAVPGLKADPHSPSPAATTGVKASEDAPTPPSGASNTRASGLAAWTNIDEEEDAQYYYFNERSRGGRKKRKKNQQHQKHLLHNWDDIYDPTRPCSYEEYRHSDERWQEVREWKDRLYAHLMARSERGSEDESNSDDDGRDEPRNYRFAPPPGLNFAPPPDLNAPKQPPKPSSPAPAGSTTDDRIGEEIRPDHENSSRKPMSFRPSFVPADATNNNSTEPPTLGDARPTSQSQPLDQVSGAEYEPDYQPEQYPSEEPDPLPPAVQSAPQPTPSTSARSAVFESATISRPPVRYTLPPAPDELPTTEEEIDDMIAAERDKSSSTTEADTNAPRSLRPGQPGFAQRLLAKYGWTQGSGLGRDESGIVQPLRVKMTKDKKGQPSNAASAAGSSASSVTAKVVGGEKAKGTGEPEGRFGALSEVVVLYGMVDGMDLDREMEGEGGGLMQEIGEECSNKYGRVERVSIHRESISGSAPVFIKFISQLSALRAVNALEGRTFNGNKITARFYDADKFEGGVYE